MATFSWQTGVGGDWSDAADWTPNGVPGSGDDVVIAAAGATVTVTGTDAAATLLLDPSGPGGALLVSGLLGVGGTLTDAGSLEIATGGALAVQGDAAISGSLSMDTSSAVAIGGDALVQGGVLTVGSGGALVVDGTLNVASGAVMSGIAYEVSAAEIDVGASAVLDLAGSTVTVAGSITSAGGKIAFGPGAVAAADVTMASGQLAGTTLTVSGQLFIGGTVDAVDATLQLGTLSMQGFASLPFQYDPAQLTLDGGAISVALSQNVVGDITLEDGAIWRAASLSLGGIGYPDLSSVLALVAGSGGTAGTLALTGGLSLSTGVLTVDGGGLLEASSLNLYLASLSLGAAGSVVLGDASAIAGEVVVGAGGYLTMSVHSTADANVVDDGLFAGTTTGSLTGGGVLDGGSQIGNAQGFAGSVTLDPLDGLTLDTGDMASALITVTTSPGAVSTMATVDLRAVAYETPDAPLYDTATGLLTVGGATLDVGLGHAAGDFAAQSDGAGGTDVLIAAMPCYAAGTGIATPRGNVPVEDLRPGDTVLTAEGPRPVRWVGRFTVDLDRHPAPRQAAPIRIAANAFAPGVPARDLWLSPDHAVLVDGVLMQAQALVNGASIVREPPVGRVTYVHVELDRHAILFAEGLPAESYLDTGNRGAFDCEAGVRPLFPDLAAARSWAADACAPLVLDGPPLTAAHARLRARAETLGHRLTTDPGLMLWVSRMPLVVARDAAGALCARLPEGRHSLRIRSRSFVPLELDRTRDDRRRLGIAVASLRLGGRALALRGDGWHAPEDGWCWTDGAATLPVRCRRPTWLRIRLAAAGARYWEREWEGFSDRRDGALEDRVASPPRPSDAAAA